MQIFWAVAAFAGTAAVVLALDMVARGRAGRTRARLRELVSAAEPGQPAPTSSARREDLMPTVTRLLSGRRLTERLYVELSAAGLPIRPSEFVGIVAASVVVFQVLAVLFVRNVAGYLLFDLIGAALPVLALKYLQRKRRTAFDAQIVNALLLMASSLRSGFSFLRSVQTVAEEMPAPISQEFQRVIGEVNVGRPLEDALRSVVARVGSYDFDLVVTSVLIQHQVGGDLAEILETIAGTIRERVRVIGEMRALTAEGRISGIILVMLPVGLAIVLAVLNPAYMSTLITETVGHYLIGAAIALQIIGGFIINRMLVLDI